MGTTFRKDYKVPSHLIDSVHLEFDLDPDSSSVTSTMDVRPNPETDDKVLDLVLNGEAVTLVSVNVNGRALAESEYTLTDTTLTIPALREAAKVVIVNRFSPSKNTALSGIYASGKNLMSQCEATGFRRITYWPDRPDVLAKFTVTIRAPKALYPVLLSNGNRVESRDLLDGRHEVRWVDPYPKPCYLFALVAGTLECRREKYRLGNGREVTLEVWVEPQDIDKTEHTMESLKRAIAWDEKRFGLYLDLDLFMIVATNDFNFGAMENKGLNIFNARYALANPAIATDRDYFNIESVVAHEYFHNWTGDRVTLRDWFQLTLKEGLTVFRDQEFSADMLGDPTARAVQRIEDVKALRAAQFPEDAGPMAHPIRPESYKEINNFYTMTVYEKGAEVIRMLHTLLGETVFRKGFDEYIRTNDGSAVTCEAFLTAMANASGRDLSQFARWFEQAGTPVVAVEGEWDPATGKFRLVVEQTTPPTPGQPHKVPLLMPFPVAFFDRDGKECPLRLETPDGVVELESPLELTEARHEWVFTGFTSAPVPSLNRGFAAPVRLRYDYSLDDLALLASCDTDPFNRWEAMQELMLRTTRELIRDRFAGREDNVPAVFFDAFKRTLTDETLSPAYAAVTLELPSERTIGESLPFIDPEAAFRAREALRVQIAKRLQLELTAVVDRSVTPGPYSPDPESAGKRALKNLALYYLMGASSHHTVIRVRDQLIKRENLTDELAALKLIVDSNVPSKNNFEVETLQTYLPEPLLVNKWLTVQATTKTHAGELPVLERVRELMKCEFFSLSNPNNVYALLLAFFTQNPSEFHTKDGEGYKFWTEVVLELDRINPHVAARVARTLENWRRYTPQLSRLQFEALENVYLHKDRLSESVLEVVEKALNNPT